jgi:hypothetical protein
MEITNSKTKKWEKGATEETTDQNNKNMENLQQQTTQCLEGTIGSRIIKTNQKTK